MERFIPSEKTILTLLGSVIGVILIALIIFWLATRHPEQTTAPETMTYSPYTFALQCQHIIEAQLKAPATAQFESPPPVKGDETSGYAESSYVDSQNSFGANLRTQFICSSTPGTQDVQAQITD